MDSRKLILDTLAMCNHDRAPHDLWTLPWATKRYGEEIREICTTFKMDYSGVPCFYREQGTAHGDDPHMPGVYIDDWGCEFINIHEGVIGEVKHPQVQDEDWEDADQVRIPREHLSVDIGKVNDFIRSRPGMFHASGYWVRPFERLQFLRGTADLYMDLMDPPPKMLQFIAQMHAFYCELLEVWAKTDVDCLNIMDDWGSQQALLISPRIWRTIFKPMYKDYVDIARRSGKKVFMHSDGHTLEILPDLIEIGVDAINTQIFCIGVDKLAPFRGKITFWGEICRQHLLPEGSVGDIERAVTQVKETLWDHGGCFAQCEFGPGGRPENVRKVFETWDRLTGR